MYVCNTRLPTEKAHGLATVKLCEAFAWHGCEVELVVPCLWRGEPEDAFRHYGIRRNFMLMRMPTLDFRKIWIPQRIAFLIQMYSFSLCAAYRMWRRYGRGDGRIVFFSHDYIPLYFLSFFAAHIFYDIHHFPGRNWMYRRVMERSVAFGVQTQWKKRALHEQWKIDTEKIVYWPNGTDIREFDVTISQDEARRKLGLPKKMTAALYTGSLFDWKGVDALIRAVSWLDVNTFIYIVGGAAADIQKYKEALPEASDKRIIFVLPRPHTEIPLWLKSANVLVLPNTGKMKVSQYYTSPMKLFEYMASKRPIVASRITSLTEIINDHSAILVCPDDPQALARGIRHALEHPRDANVLAERAFQDVGNYTWEKRAEIILSCIERNT